MKDKSCLKDYEGSLFRIGNEAPWVISVSSNQTYGYKDEGFCVECSNQEQSITSTVVKVTQKSKCMNQLLSIKDDALTKSHISYDSMKDVQTVSDSWRNYFENSDNTNCPV